MVEVMRASRSETRRSTAATAVVGLVLFALLSAVAPSAWYGGWGIGSVNVDAGTGVWIPQSTIGQNSTMPRFLLGGPEHPPPARQLRYLLTGGAVVAAFVLVLLIWLSQGPAVNPRRGAWRIVTPRSPPLS